MSDIKLPEPKYPAMRAGLDHQERVGWTEDQVREVAKQAAEMEREGCIAFLMKLHEQDQGAHNYFKWAANQLRGTK